MTEQTKVLSIRLENKDKEELQRYLTREGAEAILKQIRSGEIELTTKGIIYPSVNTKAESVYTSDESVNTDCDECPYKNDLNMSGFDEVCDYKGLDRQKALDKCVQMLWR